MNDLGEILQGILNMSITAVLVICVVLALRLVLCRAPKRFSYLLWGIVLFRLLCPVSLPTGFSAIRGETTDWGGMDYFAALPVERETDFVRSTQLSAAGKEAPPPSRSLAGSDLAGGMERVLPILAVLWLAGIAGVAGYSIWSVLGLRKSVECSMKLRDNIYLADHISTPFVFGLLRPRIYVPSGLSAEELEYVLLHEQYHIRRRDYLVKALAFLALCLHWFNPFVWVAFVMAGRDMEMSCDEAVMAGLERDARREYAGALLHLSGGRGFLAGAPLAFGEGNPKKRIKNVMRYKKPAALLSALALLICLMTAGCLMTNPSGKPQEDAGGFGGDKGSSEGDEGSSKGDSEPEPSAEFQGRILEIGNGSMLVEPAPGSQELASSDQFSVPILHMSAAREPQAGDWVEISYNGQILESYPAQLGEIFQITLLEETDPSGAGESGEPGTGDAGPGRLDAGVSPQALSPERAAAIEGLLEEISTGEPQASSNPKDYLENQSQQYRALCEYGEDAVRYCLSRFEKGEETGLEGQIMALLCQELLDLKEAVPAEEAANGQEWYEALKAYRGDVVEKYLGEVSD